MNEPNLSHEASRAMVAADDIAWTIEPDLPLEDADLFALDDEHLLAYVADLRQNTRVLRTLLSESMTAVRQLTVQSDGLRARIRTLLDALRQEHEDARALRAQVRAMQDQAA